MEAFVACVDVLLQCHSRKTLAWAASNEVEILTGYPQSFNTVTTKSCWVDR
jgi:hypothetical protein